MNTQSTQATRPMGAALRFAGRLPVAPHLRPKPRPAICNFLCSLYVRLPAPRNCREWSRYDCVDAVDVATVIAIPVGGEA